MESKHVARRLVACAIGALAVRPSLGGYALNESYVDRHFAKRWHFWTAPDPSHGSVEYVGEEAAVFGGLIRQLDGGGVYVGVDSETAIKHGNRSSIRIQSRSVYEAGLFVTSIDHMPHGCGIWPAFWMYGEDDEHKWPEWGEYDIVEGVHEGETVTTTLHTTASCSQRKVEAGKHFTGSWMAAIDPRRQADNCDVRAPGQWGNQGCSQKGPDASMGVGFNEGGGGTYAAEWDPEAGHIRTWFWRRGAEPRDLMEQRPDPDSWGMPYSHFTLSADDCDASHFRHMRLVFNINLCGDLGNIAFEKRCPGLTSKQTCAEFVRSHPEELREAYWEIQALDVYQREPTAHVTPTDAPPPEPEPLPKPIEHETPGAEPEPETPVSERERPPWSNPGGDGEAEGSYYEGGDKLVLHSLPDDEEEPTPATTSATSRSTSTTTTTTTTMDRALVPGFASDGSIPPGSGALIFSDEGSAAAAIADQRRHDLDAGSTKAFWLRVGTMAIFLGFVGVAIVLCAASLELRRLGADEGDVTPTRSRSEGSLGPFDSFGSAILGGVESARTALAGVAQTVTRRGRDSECLGVVSQGGQRNRGASSPLVAAGRAEDGPDAETASVADADGARSPASDGELRADTGCGGSWGRTRHGHPSARSLLTPDHRVARV